MFWKADCPARPPGLKHKHDRDCEDGHLPQQCCECGTFAKDWVEPDLTTLTAEEREKLRRVARGVVAGYYKP